jgi:hypothetical protein
MLILFLLRDEVGGSKWKQVLCMSNSTAFVIEMVGGTEIELLFCVSAGKESTKKALRFPAVANACTKDSYSL